MRYREKYIGEMSRVSFDGDTLQLRQYGSAIRSSFCILLAVPSFVFALLFMFENRVTFLIPAISCIFLGTNNRLNVKSLIFQRSIVWYKFYIYNYQEIKLKSNELVVEASGGEGITYVALVNEKCLFDFEYYKTGIDFYKFVTKNVPDIRISKGQYFEKLPSVFKNS